MVTVLLRIRKVLEMRTIIMLSSNGQIKQNSTLTSEYRKRSYGHVSKSEHDSDGNKNLDTGLPRELTEKFGPLHCKLCNSTASSTVSAAIHYAGKPHKKNIRKFLEDWCNRTGEPMPKLSKPDVVEIKQDVTYCNICSLVLTSVNNAQEHYAGKNHAKAVKRGFWKNLNNQETTKKTVVPAYDPTGRFGIGISHLKPDERERIFQQQQKIETKQEKQNKWVCDMCNVRAHTEEQLTIHLKGSKHLKAMKKSHVLSPVPAPAKPTESILASIAQPEEGTSSDYSMHRTPSGNYYCQCCNIVVNSSEQFNQHIESKKHKFKYASSRIKPNKIERPGSEK